MAVCGIEIAVGISVRPCDKLEIAKAPIVRKEVSSVGETKLIGNRRAKAIRQWVAELSGKLRGAGTYEHRIIHIERRALGIKYESKHWHGFLSRTRSAFELNPQLRDFQLLGSHPTAV
jgi:hypothetical protein